MSAGDQGEPNHTRLPLVSKTSPVWMSEAETLGLAYDKCRSVINDFHEQSANKQVEFIKSAFRKHGFTVDSEADLIALAGRVTIFENSGIKHFILDAKTNPIELCCYTATEIERIDQGDGNITFQASFRGKIL